MATNDHFLNKSVHFSLELKLGQCHQLSFNKCYF